MKACEETERERFERWAGKIGYCLDRRTEESLSHIYKDNGTQIVWDAWLASAAIRRPPLHVVPESPEPGETERECFEAEAEEYGMPLTRDHWNTATLSDDPEPKHGYRSPVTDAAWCFWLARASLDQGTMPPLHVVPEPDGTATLMYGMGIETEPMSEFPVVENPSGEPTPAPGESA